MNELIGHTANVMLAATNKGRLTATVELVFLVSEPKYQAEELEERASLKPCEADGV